MILPSTDHDLSVFGGLTLMSTILGGLIGDPAAAAVVALVVGVGGQLIARALAPSADALGHNLRDRFTGKHRAQQRPSKPPTEPPPGTPPST